MTVREALASGGAALKMAGIESHSLDASLLLAEVLNTSRSSLIAAAPDSIAEDRLAAFDNYIKRRLAGECVAYILGRKEFRGLEFAVNPSVLVSRPDTETLVEAALVELKKQSREPINDQPLRVLDLCTGSGAIAIALKHEMPELEVWAADISAEALETAKANAFRLLPPESIYFCQSDLFEALSDRVTVIVSNPPYVRTAEIAELSPEVRAEPILALDGGGDGLDIIKRIIDGAPHFLYPGGVLLLEADPRQMDHIAALLTKRGFTAIQIHEDLSGRERVIQAALPDGAAILNC